MKFKLNVSKVSTLSESEAAGVGPPEGVSMEDGAPFLVATIKDLQNNEQTALRSEPLTGKIEPERFFWQSLGETLWKRFSPETYPYVERDGMALVKPN